MHVLEDYNWQLHVVTGTCLARLIFVCIATSFVTVVLVNTLLITYLIWLAIEYVIIITSLHVNTQVKKLAQATQICETSRFSLEP